MPTFGSTSDLLTEPNWQVYPTGPPSMVIAPRFGVILTSGSDLDQAAVDSGSRRLPWPPVFSAAWQRFKNSWKPQSLTEVYAKVLPGNYGSKGGAVHYGFRSAEYLQPFGSQGSVGLYPGPVPNPHRPMYNNLVPIVYGLRDIELSAQSQQAELIRLNVLPLGPTDYTPAGSASLQESVL